MDDKQKIIARLFSDTSQYDDIMDCPHHESSAHLAMPREDRAVQFAPFAALTGYHKLLNETAERYRRKEYLCAERDAQILHQISQFQQPFPRLKLVYFNGQSGYYEEYNGQLQKIDRTCQKLIFADGETIVIPNIKQLKVL